MSSELRKLLKDFFSNNEVSDFSALREALGKPENSDALEEFYLIKHLFSPEEPGMNREKVWAGISSHCRAERQRMVSKMLRYAAVFMLLILAGGGLWYGGILGINRTVTMSQIEPGKKHAIIRIEDREFVDIMDVQRDTVIQHEGYVIKLSADGAISYEHNQPEDTLVLVDSIPEMMNTVFIPRGGEYLVTLPDGSRVWLNSDTEFEFTVPFKGSERRVYLKGEAFFNVAHDPDRPFVVETADLSLEVLGTKFNVNSYPNEHSSVTLTEGSLGVGCNGNSPVILKPNEQFIYRDGFVTVHEVDAYMHTAWMDGKFYFDNMPLDKIACQMERWYDITFVFADNSLKEERFTGVIERMNTANYVMETLEKIIGIQYNVENRAIHILGKKPNPHRRLHL